MKGIRFKEMSVEEAKRLGIDHWGIWECEPSKFDWEYDEQETCYIFEGDVLVTAGEDMVKLREGMLVAFPKGLKCTWEVRERVRKAYTFDFDYE